MSTPRAAPEREGCITGTGGVPAETSAWTKPSAQLSSPLSGEEQSKRVPPGSPTAHARRGLLIGWTYPGNGQLTQVEMASGPGASGWCHLYFHERVPMFVSEAQQCRLGANRGTFEKLRALFTSEHRIYPLPGEQASTFCKASHWPHHSLRERKSPPEANWSQLARPSVGVG